MGNGLKEKHAGSLSGLKFLVVGCGWTGSVVAECIASDLHCDVLVIDKRPHIGGLSFSEIDSETGIDVHRYGSHIFHTSDQEVWSYVNRFGGFNGYRHRVFSSVGGRLYPLPVNLDTINAFYNRDFTTEEAERFIAGEIAASRPEGQTAFEKKGISGIGAGLFNAFFAPYSRKQWGEFYDSLPAGVFSRLPVRFNTDSGYFPDIYQGVPLHGYGEIFRTMLNDQRISVRTGVSWEDIKNEVPPDCTVIYTGAPDDFFQCRLGRLGWRGVKFDSFRLKQKVCQSAAVINYPEPDIPYIRVHEFKHYHPENQRITDLPLTIVSREYSCGADAEPAYPAGDPASLEKYRRYRAEAEKRGRIYFAGRLGGYEYLNMDQAVRRALDLYAVIKRAYSG